MLAWLIQKESLRSQADSQAKSGLSALCTGMSCYLFKLQTSFAGSACMTDSSQPGRLPHRQYRRPATTTIEIFSIIKACVVTYFPGFFH